MTALPVLRNVGVLLLMAAWVVAAHVGSTGWGNADVNAVVAVLPMILAFAMHQQRVTAATADQLRGRPGGGQLQRRPGGQCTIQQQAAQGRARATRHQHPGVVYRQNKAFARVCIAFIAINNIAPYLDGLAAALGAGARKRVERADALADHGGG